MARLVGQPGTYVTKSRGTLVTRTGIVNCTDEEAPEFLALGFEVEEWHGPTPVPVRDLSIGESDVEMLEYVQGKVSEAKTEEMIVLTTDGYNGGKPNNARRQSSRQKKG